MAAQRARSARRAALLGAALIAATPAVAAANAGGAMVWGFGGFFVVGNVVLGLIEGSLIAGIARLRRPWRAIAAMTLANFASFFVGLATIHEGYGALLTAMGGPPIDAVIPTLIVLAVAAYAATALVEWPACWLSMRRRDAPRTGWGRALVVCAAVNAATYAMLTVWNFNGSDLSLVLETERAEAADVLEGAPPFDLHVIGADGASVERWSWDGERLDRRARTSHGSLPARRAELVTVPPVDLLAETHPLPRLALATSLGRGGEAEDLGHVPGAPAALAAWNDEIERIEPADGTADTLRRPDRPVWWDARPPDERAWFPTTRWMRMGALSVIDTTGERRLRLRLRTIGGLWRFDRPIALPGDVLVFETEGQILALHVPTGRLAFVCAGRSPVVLTRAGAPGQAGE